MARTSTKALADLDSALRAWGEAAQEVSSKASASVKRVVADVEREVQARARRVAVLESEIAVARGEARARLARELQAATSALERGRRGVRQAKDAERRMQVLQRRMSEATGTRVPRASQALRHKLRALTAYSSVPTAGTATSSGSGDHSSQAQICMRLIPMVARAVVTEAVDAAAHTGDQTTAHLPERLQDPVSLGLAAFGELHSNWDLYSHTPEMFATRVRNLWGSK